MSSTNPDPNDSSIRAYELPEVERPASAEPTVLEYEAPVPHDPYAALRIPDYRTFTAGFAVANVGQAMLGAAVAYEVYSFRHDVLAMAWIGVAQVLPTLLLSLPAGQLADWLDRRRLLITSQFLSVICMLGLAALSYAHGHGHVATRTTEWLIYLLLAANGSALTLGRPSRAAMVPRIVPPALFSNAATWNSSVFEVSSMLGPAIGGFLLAYSLPITYLLSALCGIWFMIAVATLRGRYTVKAAEPPSLAGVATGIRFVWNTKTILAAITLDLFAVLFGGVIALFPAYADKILHVTGFWYGLMFSASGLGAISMSLFQAHRRPMKHAGRNLLLAVAGFGFATIIFGFSRWYWLSLAMLFLVGACDNISVVIRHTLVQLLTPDSMRGRVSAVNGIFIGASNELGRVESGVVGKLCGLVFAAVSGGVGTILVVLAVSRLLPQITRIGSLVDLRPAGPQAPSGDEAVAAKPVAAPQA